MLDKHVDNRFDDLRYRGGGLVAPDAPDAPNSDESTSTETRRGRHAGTREPSSQGTGERQVAGVTISSCW